MLKFAIKSVGVLLAIGLWCVIAVFLAFEGWWLKPIAPAGDHEAFFAAAARIAGDANKGATSFILIEDGEIVDEYHSAPQRVIDRNTVFPTASFSKWITALGVMTLVEDGLVGLDDPVSRHLTRWRLPASDYDNDGVTIRRLLSHTAGLSDSLGFADYGADEPVPTLEQSLSNPRASDGRDAAIVVGEDPGKAFAYSGGGYLILQLLIEEASGREYQRYIGDEILSPLNMQRSSFAFIGDIDGATPSFNIDGNLAPQYRYSAAAATGFSSSAADLARLVAAIVNEDPAAPLSAEAIASMRKPEAYMLGSAIWGLGTMLYAPTAHGDHAFGHDGANEPAINAAVRINPESGDAFIMLANGHRSIATALGGEWVLWQTGKPDFLSTEKALKSAMAPAAIGVVVILFLVAFASRRKN